MKGKKICNVLREVRQRIADANGISYHPHDCHYEGDCLGTCPACEQEKSYLESSLKELKRQGFAIKVAGIAAGLIASASPVMASNESESSFDSKAPITPKTARQLQLVDLSDGASDSITINGIIVDKDDKPALGASVSVEGRKDLSCISNLDGRFSIRVSRKSTLRITFLGMEDLSITVEELLKRKDYKIILKNDDSQVTTGIVAVGYDGVKKQFDNSNLSVDKVTIKGFVYDENSRPFNDVWIFIDGKPQMACASNSDGFFTVSAPRNATLSFRYQYYLERSFKVKELLVSDTAIVFLRDKYNPSWGKDLSNGSYDAVSITGTVVDKNNEPFIGATVSASGTSEKCQTDFDGKFSIYVSRSSSLTISYLGCEDESVKVEDLLKSKDKKIYLEVDSVDLSDVIPMGYIVPKGLKSEDYGRLIKNDKSGLKIKQSQDGKNLYVLVGKTQQEIPITDLSGGDKNAVFIYGKVVDEEGYEMCCVSVEFRLKKWGIDGIITGSDGEFYMIVPPNVTLTFKEENYKVKKVKVKNLLKAKSKVIKMEPLPDDDED